MTSKAYFHFKNKTPLNFVKNINKNLEKTLKKYTQNIRIFLFLFKK